MKNLKKWLIPAGILLLVAGGALVLVFTMGVKQDKEEPYAGDNKLYWNVDGPEYRSQKSVRYTDSEGYIYITFACDGKQERLPVRDMKLAQKIDALEVMGLEFDENGVVIDCHRVEDFTGGMVARRYYVTAIDGTTVTCNSSVTLKGYDVKFHMDENTPVWDVGSVGITCGVKGSLKINDCIYVILNTDGSTNTVYVLSYQAPPPIYWNVDRKYDSATKTTTREMDPTGGYTITVALEGQQTTVRTRDYEIVKAIDGMSAKCFALEFDEEGMVSRVIHAGTAAGGGSCASWHRINSIEGKTIDTAHKSNGGTFNGVLSAEVQIYDVSGYGEYVGVPSDMRVGDTVHCLRDSLGRVAIVFVVDRIVDSEMYWNVERMWDAKTSLTTRRPARDGWYYITVAVRGKQTVVKTQNKEHVQAIDARAAKCFGLKLEGDVIQAVYQPNSVTGGSTFASWYDITELVGDHGIVCKKSSTGDIRKGSMLPDCEIYNVSALAGTVGEVTTLQVGDRIHALKDGEGKICVVYVVNRFLNLPTYYNLDRKWDANKQQTTRTPDANGYYEFQMAYKGKIVTVKTKSKTVANDIDSQAAKCVALQISGGIVTKAIHPKDTVAYKGGSTSSYTYVTSISSSGFKTKKVEKGVVTKTYDETISPNCLIYNVSDNVVYNRGEVTKLQVGDYVHCLKNKDGQVALIYVLGRYANLGVYYNLDRMWDDNTQTTTRTPDADGYYVFRMAHKGQEVTVKTASLAVAKAIDSQVAKVLGIGFDKNGLANKAIHAKSTTECKGGIGASYVTVTAISGNKITYTKSGKTDSFTLASKPNIFDVSTMYADHQGERSTIRVGDMIHCLKADGGKTNYVYILSRKGRVVETEHTCEHVTENVQWYDWNGKTGFGQSGHYVLNQDAVLTSTVTVEAGTEVTLCLNGHTVSSDVRFFKVYGKLNICDHKDAEGNYQGKLTSSYSDTVDAEGVVTTKAYASLAYLYNANASSELNIYGGIFEHTGSLTAGGLVYVANSSDNPDNTAVFNLYDGVLTGGNATAGGAVLVSNVGGFGMHGGKITNCSANRGGAVAVQNAKAVVLMDGGVIENCTAKQTGAGIQIDSGSMLMTDGLITKNTATGNGGGISMDKGELTIQGGTLDGNFAKEGGNLRIAKDATVVLQGDAKVMNGDASNGGNITMYGKLTVMENAHITGGKAKSATAIYVYSNFDDSQTELTFLGGTTEGGIRFTSKKGQSVNLYLLGGSVDTVAFVNTTDATVTPQVYVGGDVQVKKLDIWVSRPILIYEDSLEDTASIGIVKQNITESFVTITDPKDEACFHPVEDSKYKIVNVDNQLFLASLYEAHAHCLCNGAAEGLGDHVCEATTEWTPWTETDALPTTSGSYYLTEDVTLSAMFEMKGKLDLKICLNGHTITGPGGGKRVFLLRDADLSITDCVGSGVITNAVTESLNGGLIYQYSGSSCNKYNNSVNLYGGTLTVTGKARSGGVLYLGNSMTDGYFATFNMYGGKITGGNTVNESGNINISNNSVCNIYGGEISNGKSGLKGGNITHYTGTLNLLGGKITGGSPNDVDVNSKCIVGGNVQVENLYLLSGKQLTVSDDVPLNGADVGITMEAAGVFITLTDPNTASCFHSRDASMPMQQNGNSLSLGAAAPVGHTHCICNGNGKELGGHVCDDATQWTEWPSKTALPTTSGSYYLTEDVTLSAMFEMKGKLDLKICLNGHTITGPGGGKRVFLLRDADLSITDCQGSGVITNQVTDSLNGGLIYQYSGSSCNKYNNSVNLYAGTLTVTGKAKSGGVLFLGNSVTDGYFATFNMYGGKIQGGQTTGEGGNINITNNCVFNLYAGQITGGASDLKGGNITFYLGQLNLLGGSVTGGAPYDVMANNPCAVGGNVQVDNLYLASGQTLAVSADLPLDGALLGITMDAPSLFATNVTNEAWQAYFTNAAGWSVVYDPDTQTLSWKA